MTMGGVFMKKGDLRRDSILRMGRELFFEKGYDETSIQDILNALSISKGAFYHYFDSKQALLEEICRQQSDLMIEKLRMDAALGRLTPVQKMNMVLSQVNIFSGSDPRLNALMLKISYIDGDVNFREHIRGFMLPELGRIMGEVIREGMEDGSFFTRNPAQLGKMLLMLAYDINDEACRMLCADPENPDCVILIADLLNAYRDAVENLSGATFGSVQLFDLEQLLLSFRQTAKELKLIAE